MPNAKNDTIPSHERRYNCGVYTITAPSGNLYIGSSENIRKRWAEHLKDLQRGNHHSHRLQDAWNKYGEALKFGMLLVCEAKDLLLYEQRAMNVLKPVYNVSQVAGSRRGVKQPPEWVEALKVRQTGTRHTEETKAKMRAAALKRWESREAREAASVNGLNRKHSEETKAKISAAKKGRVVSAEERKNRSLAWRNSEKSKNHLMTVILNNIGKKHSVESIEKFRQSRKGYRHSPETRQKIGRANRAAQYRKDGFTNV